MGRPWHERAAAYIDSPRMVQRLRTGTLASASIRGTAGTYRVTADPASHLFDCTCPSPDEPCKHVAALVATFEARPESFADVDALLAVALEGMDREELMAIIRSMALVAPGSLGVLGVAGMSDEAVEDAQ